MPTTKNISYINKDFTSLKQALIDYATNYYPNTYSDFSDASPGMMFIEMASYVGDVLSFYIDKQVQENFLEYAQERDNLVSLAYSLGYKPKVTSTANVVLDVYQQLPALIQSGAASPDYSYCLTIDKGAQINSTSNNQVSFITQNLVDFSFSSSTDTTDVSVYLVNQTTGQPEYYLLHKQTQAIAGTIKTQTFSFGAPIKFQSVTIQDTNVIQILDVTDSNGNKWYEVPYLAQNTIYEQVSNNYLNDPFLSQYSNSTPYLLKLLQVPRRFVSRFDGNNNLNLEFGAGILTSDDEVIIPNTNNVGLGIVDGITKMNLAFDPSNFMFTKDYGLAPSNITMTVTYIVGGGVSTNVPSNDLTKPSQLNINTVSLSPNTLNQNLLNYIISSVSFNNSLPASGGGDGDSTNDIRLNTIANFPSQMRNVTKEDHIIRSLTMPSQFGTIAKSYITQDLSLQPYDKNSGFVESNPLQLSMYILSYDSNMRLVTGSLALKQNLSNYISQFRMLNDAIVIKDAYFINIGVYFEIVVLPSHNSRTVLSDCLSSVQDYFNIENWQINQPIVIADIFNVIASVPGVQNVMTVNITNNYGVSNGYSPYAYDIQGATMNNVIYPSLDPSIFEVRYPQNDIFGRVINF